ncbi:tail fiber assembly protein [Enterobacter ludwigii]
MQNIKNFIRYSPGTEIAQAFTDSGGSVAEFLVSEDGIDWYECQEMFADDTVKIMYDADGIIRGLIDKPIPQRGNAYAVSMFFPDGMSVAEVAGVPEGCSIDGDWMFDGEKVIPVPVDYVAQAEREKSRLAKDAEAAIAPLQRAVKYNIDTLEEASLLEEWEIYTVLLSRIDTSQAPDINWPRPPQL